MGSISGIGVVDRSVALPAGLVDLVERTGTPRAAAYRLAVALETHRLLVRDSPGAIGDGDLVAYGVYGWH